jgi:membrane fusion protein (multidrug efflux system)
VAKLNVERSRVAAPFEGGISQRVVGRGDYVKIGSPLFEIVNDAILKFIFAVPERNASFVRKGLPVSFSVDNYPGEQFTGSVYLISPSVSTVTRAFNVGALVTNAEFRLKANTFARGFLVLERGVPTPVVPLEAVVSFAGVTKVFRVQDNKAESRAVKAGRIRDGLQEIMEGVNLGDQVVVTGTTKLTDGMSVTIQASGQSEIKARPVQVSGTNAVAGKRHGGE